MYFVGIDISKFKHDCFITTESGEFVINSFSFKNDNNGFQELLSVLKSLDSTQEIRIGFEATAHYALNLKESLLWFPFSGTLPHQSDYLRSYSARQLHDTCRSHPDF